MNSELCTILILGYALIDILAWRHGGILLNEFATIQDLHNERTFLPTDLYKSKLLPPLFIQYFLFFGLGLLYATSATPTETLNGLLTFEADTYISLAICIAIPAAWSLIQYSIYNWIIYIIGGDSRVAILNRVMRAVILLSGPLTLIVFALAVTVNLSALAIAILLTAIFIIAQIIFIFSGYTIFFKRFGALYIFFVYLCALEIAPLAIIFAKIGAKYV